MIVNDQNVPSIRGIMKVGFIKTEYTIVRDVFKRYLLKKDI